MGTTATTQQAYQIALAPRAVCEWFGKLRLDVLQDRLDALHPRHPVTVAWGIDETKVPLKHSVAHTFSTTKQFGFFNIRPPSRIRLSTCVYLSDVICRLGLGDAWLILYFSRGELFDRRTIRG